MHRLLVVIAVVLLAGCTGAASPSSPPSAAVTASQAARLYPYELPWPDDELEGAWRHASAVWDGVAQINHGNRYTDSVSTTDGDLFAFGYETGGTAEDFQALTADQAAEWHACNREAMDEAPLSGGGEPGILAVYDCAGRTVLRWFAVHDGFGLAVLLIVAPGADADSVRARFEERIGTLVWSN